MTARTSFYIPLSIALALALASTFVGCGSDGGTAGFDDGDAAGADAGGTTEDGGSADASPADDAGFMQHDAWAPPADAGQDTGADASPSMDSGSDAGLDAGVMDGAVDAAVDASVVDAAPDAAPDATVVDASVDGSNDATVVDATVDAPVDATIDATVDATVDAALDATVDATLDATLDATVDAAPDASMPDAAPGCTAPTDCPVGQSCNTSTGVCSAACGAAQNSLCNGGCCANGVCSPGTAGTACGVGGGSCSDCTSSSAGAVCTAGQCGCTTNQDCPNGEVCGAVVANVCSPPPSFGQTCDGGTTRLTGQVFAPNGVDPIPNVRVYAASQINPYPTNYCDKCSAPIDPAYAATTTAADGSFSLSLDYVQKMPSITFTIQIGRFRKHTTLPVTACQTTTVPALARTLPGNSVAGDIPRIAVSSGNADHLDVVLSDLGITEYDCYEGRKTAGASTSTCNQVANTNIANVLANASTLDQYHMAFLSCAPGAYGYFTSQGGVSQAAMTQNTQAWVAGGGRLFATDTAYDYIAQPFPSNITWEGPSGSPQPVDGANLGCSSGASTNYAVKIDDPLLAQWLGVVNIFPTPIPSPPMVNVLGFYNRWSAIASLPASTQLISDGAMPLDLTSASTKCASGAALTTQDVPLTAQFDVSGCGRVIYSSYHTDAGASTSSAQMKIMEYLIFDAAYCAR